FVDLHSPIDRPDRDRRTGALAADELEQCGLTVSVRHQLVDGSAARIRAFICVLYANRRRERAVRVQRQRDVHRAVRKICCQNGVLHMHALHGNERSGARCRRRIKGGKKQGECDSDAPYASPSSHVSTPRPEKAVYSTLTKYACRKQWSS